MENINNIITMNKNNNDTTNKNNNSSSMTEITTTKKCQGETRQPGLQLYKSAARNLREYHGVPSITAESVEKTMALLQLRPARLVAQGLTSRKLLKAEAAMPDSSLDSNSSSDSSTNSDVEMDENAITSDTSDSGGTISISTDNSGSDDDDNEINHDLEAEDCKRPVHTALAAAGIKLRPRETRPLLLALGVRPQRLVKLGLVDREALLRSRRITLGRAIGRVRGEGRQHQHGPPGRRAHRGGGEGVGTPQYSPHPHPRDHVHGMSPARRGLARSSSPVHGLHEPHGPHRPPRGPFHRTGRHGHQHHDHMQPFHDVPHGSRHLGRPNHTTPPPPGARMHPHRGSFHLHSGESDGEKGVVVHRGSPGRGHDPSHGRGCGKRGPPRNHGRPDHGRPNDANAPRRDARMHPHHEPAFYHSGESDGEERAVMHRGSPGRGRGPSRGRGDGPPRHDGGGPNHGRLSLGRRPHGGERHPNHEHGFHH